MKARVWILVALVLLALVPMSASASQAVIPPKRTPINIGKFKLQIRYGAPHPLGACVAVPVEHIHVELFQAKGNGRYKYLFNFHIGKWYNGFGNCYVVWENQTDYCARTCNTTKRQLRRSIRDGIIAIGALFGITIAVWLAALMARVLVPVMVAL